MKIINVGIMGAAGYTGGELIRLLIHHPNAIIKYAYSRSQSGKAIHTTHEDLFGMTDLTFSESFHFNVDVIFLCLGHGESKIFVEENEIPNHIKIIDLTNDFRLKNNSKIASRSFIYGLPELNKDSIIKAQNIANPGCFATAIQLGLLPLAKNKLLNTVYTTGITGSTGAGQNFSSTSHFSFRSNNIQAYKTLTHQHLDEINQTLIELENKVSVNFVPWRGDFTRGIFISSQTECTISEKDLIEMYESFYLSHPFVKISKSSISLKQVVNTNNCFIQLEKVNNTLVIHSIIDNLLKGASGQAIQNMNLMFELDETTGLKLKANYF